MHYKIFLCVLLFPVSLSAQNGELSLTLEQSASLMNKGSRTLQMADKAVDIARSERQKMNAFWYPSLNASGAYVHLSNHIEVKEPLRQFTDPAKDFVHSIIPDDQIIWLIRHGKMIFFTPCFDIEHDTIHLREQLWIFGKVQRPVAVCEGSETIPFAQGKQLL